MSEASDRGRLRVARQWLLESLRPWGVEEHGHLVVAGPRSVRDERGARRQRLRLGDCIGYYSAMSQYRSRIRIVVVVASIRRELGNPFAFEDDFNGIEREIERTVAHEYGHVMAEAVRVEGERGNRWNVPEWPSSFDGDEEAFAEDFARYLTGDANSEKAFWADFMSRYGHEWRRTFCEPARDCG